MKQSKGEIIVIADVIQEVTIPEVERHEGLYFINVLLHWKCPQCGQPRGKVENGVSFDGSLRLYCHAWKNPCGHVDSYNACRREARMNGLNEGRACGVVENAESGQPKESAPAHTDGGEGR